jgi:ubiquinone/menaquinone biosynthesis C-methylase UbiE
MDNVQFVLADAMDLSQFREGEFDAVYSLTAIKHFPEPVRGLSECLRVLRPGGLLFIAEICRESTLQQVRALTELFDAPAAVRALAAHGVYGSLRQECPSLETVQGWLAQVSPAVAPRRLEGLPAWVATLSRSAPAGR